MLNKFIPVKQTVFERKFDYLFILKYDFGRSAGQKLRFMH